MVSTTTIIDFDKNGNWNEQERKLISTRLQIDFDNKAVDKKEYEDVFDMYLKKNTRRISYVFDTVTKKNNHICTETKTYVERLKASAY